MAGRRSGDLLKHLSSLFRVGTLAGVSDAQLLERFVAGRNDAGEMAFRALVERHGPMVLRVCQSVLGNRHDAEDAFQVTFLVLARKAGSIRKQRSLGSWLHGVAHHVALRALTAARSRSARQTKVAKAAETADPSPEPGEDQSDLAAALHQEITRLPAKYRAPIVLCYLQGMTHDQAASELGWPVGTVRGRLARARDSLRTRLTLRGLTLSAGLVAAGALPETASAALPAALVEMTIKAALDTAVAGVLTRTAALLLKPMLGNMALVRLVRSAAVLVMIALVAGAAAMLAYSGRTKLSGERTTIAKIKLVLPPAPTDLAGDPLPAGALARLGTTRFLHAFGPTQIAYSTDGATLASFDGSLYLWDPLTGRERHRIETGAGRGTGYVPFAYAPDGQSLAVQGDFATKLYDPRSGREIRRFEGKGTPNCLAFSPDGHVLAGGLYHDEKPVITLWEVASGRVIRRIACLPLTLSLAFLPDGKVLISCVYELGDERPKPRLGTQQPPLAEESAIYLWEVATGKKIRRMGMGKTRIKQAVLALDGKTLATAATDKTVRLWDVDTGRELRRFGGGDMEPGNIAFSPNGTQLASTESRDNNFQDISKIPPLSAPMHLWDTATGRELRHWEADNDSLVCFSPDGTTLASGGGQVIRLWDVASGREIRPPTGHRSAIGDSVFAPDGRSIVTAGHDRTIRFWDPTTGREIRQLEGSDSDLRFAALSADGRTLAAGGGFQPTRLWDVASGRELRRFQMPGKIDDQYVSCADLSPDGKTLATSRDEGVMFWDTATGERRAGELNSRMPRTNVTELVKALRFAPDGASVATSAEDSVRIWDVARATETRRITMPNAPPGPLRWRNGPSLDGAHLAFSPDGRFLAASSERDGLICLLDMSSGRELSRLEGTTGYHTKAFAFSPNGKILATGIETGKELGRELSIRLWDVAARRDLCRVKAHLSEISALAFSPDGRRLVSASEDGTALVWDVAVLAGSKTAPAADRQGEGIRRE